MNRADWMTAGGAMIGILGIAFGFWWADAVAAGFISLDVVRDGLKNLIRVVRDLMDQQPTEIDGDPSDVPERVQEALRGLDWVRWVDTRFRNEGRLMTGEAFVVPWDEHDLDRRFAEALEVARAVDWRVHDVVFTLVAPNDWPGALD